MGVALDTNIFILAYNQKNSRGDKAQELLEKILHSGDQIFISVVVFEEFLVKIYKLGLEKNISDYENFLTAGGVITVMDVTRQIAKSAAKIRADYPSVRAPDAIHIASAIEAGAKLFITTDRRLPKKINKLEIKSL